MNKAYDIDDPLFLWMAQQIVKHPLDPYGAVVHWSSTAEPMWIAMQNPPLCAYYMAAVGSAFGFGEVVMHLAFLLPAIGAVLGTFSLARRFCSEPLTAAVLTLFTPVFLISASHVMCDVFLVAFWVWAIHFWIDGMDRQRWTGFLCSALLITAATFTKYFGISLVPLLLLYTIYRSRKLRANLLFLTVPLSALIAFEVLTKEKYGTPLFTGAMVYLRNVAVDVRIPVTNKVFTGFAFIGGCLISTLFLVPLRRLRSALISLASLLLFGWLFWIYVPLPAEIDPWNAMAIGLQGCVFATVGLGILALTLRDVALRRDAESLLLASWVFGTFVFATFMNWSITARTILPMAPAVALLLVRSWEQRPKSPPTFPAKMIGITAALLVSLMTTTADYYEADASRAGARALEKRFRHYDKTIWFQSHWGFQFYMEQWNAKPLTRGAPTRSGDLLMIPSNNADRLPPGRPTNPRREITRSVLPWVAAFAPGTGTGFYSSVRGPLPWAFVKTAPYRFEVFQYR
ncbi:MAG: ArnT family glycosyltransferase [Chthoniobacterales bacterium]